MPDGEKPDGEDRKEPVTAEETKPGGGGSNVIPFRPAGPSGREDVPEAEDDAWWMEEEESGDDGDGDDAGRPRFPAWVSRMVVAVIALALVTQAAAILPRIYNVDVIRLLVETRHLSQDERVQAYKAAIVVVEAGDRKGTGFNISEHGLVVTNRHVIEGSRDVVVGFGDGRVLHARVAAEDGEADLALLVPDVEQDERFPTLELDPAGTWSPDDEVYYIGNPLFFRHLAGRGTVLGWANAGKPFPVLLVEAPIHPGNSGSPVIAGDGRVIGVFYASTELELDDRKVKAGLAIPAGHPFLAEAAGESADRQPLHHGSEG